jgi:hypothetical protein
MEVKPLAPQSVPPLAADLDAIALYEYAKAT